MNAAPSRTCRTYCVSLDRYYRNQRMLFESLVPTPWLCVTKIPLFLAMQEVLHHCEPLLPSITAARVVLPLQSNRPGDDTLNNGAERSTYAIMFQMESSSAAEELARDYFNGVVISALCAEPCGWVFLSDRCNDLSAATDLCDSSFMMAPSLATPTRSSIIRELFLGLPSAPQKRSQSPLVKCAVSPPFAAAAAPAVPCSGADSQPTQCTICLDSLSERSVLVTLCNHVFHLECFAQCQAGDSCPLCRFDLTLIDASSQCEICQSYDDLWMCVICGKVHCGRTSGRHGELHFVESGHHIAVQVGGFTKVWDYLEDQFVHRLAMVEDGGVKEPLRPPSRWCDDDDDELDRVLLESKVELVSEYYTKLMNNQLEQQRAHYELLLTECNVVAPFVESECIARCGIVQEAVETFRREVWHPFRLGVTSMCDSLRQQTKVTAEKEAFLSTTLQSVREGAVKCKALLNNMSKSLGGNAQIAAKEKRAAELRGEVDRLFAALYGGN